MIVPMHHDACLTPDERRQVGIAALTAAAVALATGLVNWGLEEAKSFVVERRKARAAAECRSDAGAC